MESSDFSPPASPTLPSYRTRSPQSLPGAAKQFVFGGDGRNGSSHGAANGGSPNSVVGNGALAYRGDGSGVSSGPIGAAPVSIGPAAASGDGRSSAPTAQGGSRSTLALLAEIEEKKKQSHKFGWSWEYPYFVTPKPYRWIRWSILISIFVGVTLTGTLLLQLILEKAITRIRRRGTNFYVSPNLQSIAERCEEQPSTCTDGASYDGFSINIFPQKFDTDAMQITFNFDVETHGNLDNVLNIMPPGYNVTFNTGAVAVSFTEGQLVTHFTATYAAYASIYYYPFEEYEVYMDIFAQHSLGEDPKRFYDMVLTLNFGTNIPGFEFRTPRIDSFPGGDGISAVRITAPFIRNGITRVAVVFTWLVMHGWAIMAVVSTLQVAFRGRDADVIMTWTASSVFTVGAIRAIQPRAPVIGTVGDLVSYCWAVILISFASFFLFVFNFRRYKPKSEEDKVLEKKEKESKWRAILKDEEDEEAKEKAGLRARVVPRSGEAIGDGRFFGGGGM